MISLIKNEFYKIKFSKIILSFIIYIVLLLLMNKYSNKSIKDLSFNMIVFIGIFNCLLFSGTISNEIDRGTFKYYLTKPVSRYKVYTSKLITMFTYIYCSELIIIIFISIISFNIDLMYYSKFFTYSLPLYVYSSLIIYLSNMFKSTSLVICISILLLSFSLFLSQILFNIHFNIIEFTFLPYLDFTLFDDKKNLKVLNDSYKIALSLKKGVLIDMIYTLILFLMGNISFMRKDIKS